MFVQLTIMTEGGRDTAKHLGLEGCMEECEDAWSCCRKGYKCPKNEEDFEDMMRKRQQYISHVTKEKYLPQEVEDFIELQIIKQIKRIVREKVIRDGICVYVCKYV